MTFWKTVGAVLVAWMIYSVASGVVALAGTLWLLQH